MSTGLTTKIRKLQPLTVPPGQKYDTTALWCFMDHDITVVMQPWFLFPDHTRGEATFHNVLSDPNDDVSIVLKKVFAPYDHRKIFVHSIYRPLAPNTHVLQVRYAIFGAATNYEGILRDLTTALVAQSPGLAEEFFSDHRPEMTKLVNALTAARFALGLP